MVPEDLVPAPLRTADGQHPGFSKQPPPLIAQTWAARNQPGMLQPKMPQPGMLQPSTSSSPLQGSVRSVGDRQGSSTQGVRPDRRVGFNSMHATGPMGEQARCSTRRMVSTGEVVYASGDPGSRPCMSEGVRPGDPGGRPTSGDPGSRPYSHSSCASGRSASSTDQGFHQLASSYGPPLLRPQMSRRVTAMLERTTFSGAASANGAGASYSNEEASGGGSGAGHCEQMPPMRSMSHLCEGDPPQLSPLHFYSTGGLLPPSEVACACACATAHSTWGNSTTSVCGQLGGQSGRPKPVPGMTLDLASVDSWAPLATSRPASVHPPPGTPALYDMLSSLQFDVATQQQVSVCMVGKCCASCWQRGPESLTLILHHFYTTNT